MINYDKQDHSNYLAERCYYLCSLAGIEPVFIDETNYDLVRDAIYLSLTGSRLRDALIELSGILYFSIVTKEV
jgi:hypothetical protein